MLSGPAGPGGGEAGAGGGGEGGGVVLSVAGGVEPVPSSDEDSEFSSCVVSVDLGGVSVPSVSVVFVGGEGVVSGDSSDLAGGGC